jgi:hypothetical protein
VIEGDPETSQCPRCGSRRHRDRRRAFYRTDDADEAREARSRLLAKRQGAAGSFDEIDHFADLEAVVDEAGPDDETYLEGSGLDPEPIAEAGERASSSEGSRSREETVRAAIRSLEEPDEAAIASYCEGHGVGPEAAGKILEKLVRAGEVSRREGGYRLL